MSKPNTQNTQIVKMLLRKVLFSSLERGDWRKYNIYITERFLSLRQTFLEIGAPCVFEDCQFQFAYNCCIA